MDAQSEPAKTAPASKPKMENKAPKANMALYAAVAVVIILAVVGVVYYAQYSAAQVVVANGDNVSVYYTGAYQNGTVFNTNEGGSPLNFTVGSGQMISGFNNAVIGMKLNQTMTVTLPPSEAYGEVNQSLFISVPRGAFKNTTPAVGMQVQNSNGQVGTVAAINLTNVTVDFNPPLAGKTLVFTIKVVSISK